LPKGILDICGLKNHSTDECNMRVNCEI
jgi:hypothetical protein